MKLPWQKNVPNLTLDEVQVGHFYRIWYHCQYDGPHGPVEVKCVLPEPMADIHAPVNKKHVFQSLDGTVPVGHITVDRIEEYRERYPDDF